MTLVEDRSSLDGNAVKIKVAILQCFRRFLPKNESESKERKIIMIPKKDDFSKMRNSLENERDTEKSYSGSFYHSMIEQLILFA